MSDGVVRILLHFNRYWPSLILVSVLAVAGVAWGDVYQPGTQPRTYPPALLGSGDNQLPVGPLVAGTTVGGLQLERAAYCVECHTSSDSTAWPGNGWKGTMMANAARDPLFYAALAIANQDSSPSNPLPGNPDYIGGDYCLRCHSPAGFLDGHTMANPPATINGHAVAADATNPNRYPCNSYDPASPNLCRCLAAGGDCTAMPTDRDFCAETPERIANGYCLIDFENPAARLHPSSTMTHAEPYEQLVTNGDGETADVYDDTEGVQCALCHRLDPAGNAARQFGGNYLLSTVAASDPSWLSPRAMRFGPYATMGLQSGDAHPHPGQYSALHTEGTLCGLCHDVTNPVLDRLDSDGSDRGYKMPIERTFSEWAASDYRPGGALDKSCQGCHMPPFGATTPVCFDAASGSQGLARSGVPQHILAGGNAWIPTVFRDVQPPMGGAGDPAWLYALVSSGTASYTEYDNTQASARGMLSAAAMLTRQDTSATAAAGQPFTFTLRTTNLTGHKLPTGYPEGRRMWLMVTAQGGGQTLLDSGDYDSSTGILTRDGQLKIYEIELGAAGATPTAYPQQFHFVRNQIVYSDNRIPPSGFDSTAANFDEMAPVPARLYPTTSGKLPNWDDTSYTVTLPPDAAGDLVVSAQLVYQTASKDYVDFLDAGNSSNARGSDLKQVWLQHDRAPYVVMATASFSVPIVAAPPGSDLALPSDLDASAELPDLSVAPADLAGSVESADLAGGKAAARAGGCSIGGLRGTGGADATSATLLLLLVALLLRRRYSHLMSSTKNFCGVPATVGPAIVQPKPPRTCA
jgi:hypothetical protein